MPFSDLPLPRSRIVLRITYPLLGAQSCFAAAGVSFMSDFDSATFMFFVAHISSLEQPCKGLGFSQAWQCFQLYRASKMLVSATPDSLGARNSCSGLTQSCQRAPKDCSSLLRCCQSARNGCSGLPGGLRFLFAWISVVLQGFQKMSWTLRREGLQLAATLCRRVPARRWCQAAGCWLLAAGC